MLKTDAIKHFGSAYALAKALGIKRQSVALWGVHVPIGRALQLEKYGIPLRLKDYAGKSRASA